MDSLSFLDHLKSSGLLHDEQVAVLSDRFSNSAMQVIVADLVDEGLLTPFQVKQLHAGQPKGLVLGQYHLLDELGRGGYGCVYKARHKLMDRIVALKVIAPERVEDSRAKAWFRREVLAATQLTHPNIALAYDADEIDGILFFAMEYVDGLNLDTLVRQRGPLPIGTACELLLQTAKALQYAHEKGMVHRDIKPANLLVPRGTIADAAADWGLQGLGATRPILVKVVDFGLARLQSSSSNNTLVLQNERGFVGTPAYVSPEQARNVHEVDIRSDLYSLGCTFYYALAGHAPFQASTPLQVIVQHLEREADALELHRPEVPPALASIIRRLMAKKPESRFQSPAELLSELGFFYGLDRSGLQRVMPFAGIGAAPVVSERRSSIDVPALSSFAVHRATDVQARLMGVESAYEPTRVYSWDASEAGADKPAEAVTPASIAPPPTLMTPTLVPPAAAAATATYVSNEAAAAPAGDGAVQALDRDLIQLWQEWASLVADLSAGRASALNDAAYRVLHRQLVQTCQQRAAGAAPAQAALVRRIADLVQPWLSLPTLGAMDRETRASLQQQCQVINEKLGMGAGSLGWLIAALVVMVVAGAGFLAWQWLGTRPVSAWLDLIQRHPIATAALALPTLLVASAALTKTLMRLRTF